MSRLQEFSNVLFNSNEQVCAGSLFENDVKPFLDSIGSMFYTVNPIHSRIDFGYKEKDTYDELIPRRADVNCSAFRNFMFEFDTESLEDQIKIIKGCGIPFSAVVYSGNKSYHALLCLDKSLGGCHTKEGIEHYKNIWKRLSLKIEHYANELGFSNVVDQSGKNPSRFTRMPYTVRDNGNTQDLMFLNTRISFEDFQILLKSCPKVFVNVIKSLGKLEVESVEQFLNEAPKQLVNEIKYPINVAPNGQYSKIFRLSIWMRDLGVSKELCEQVLNYKLFPALISVGYREDRLTIGVDHAYKK